MNTLKLTKNQISKIKVVVGQSYEVVIIDNIEWNKLITEKEGLVIYAKHLLFTS
jgi:hypothetical protein